MTTPAKLPPKMPPPAKPTKAPEANGEFTISSGRVAGPQRILLYGTAGVGKSSLAALLASAGKRPLFLDLDDGSKELDVKRIASTEISTWDRLRAALRGAYWTDFDSVVGDTLTKAEQLATTDVCAKSGVDGLEKADGGYGKGYRTFYERMLLLLSDMDGHIRKGRDVILIAHDCIARAVNPAGADFIRHEPNLYQSERHSVRAAVKQWADHVFFIGYDVASKDGKAQGSGSRTIYVQEQPHLLAKSRTLRDPIVFEEGSAELWNQLFGSTT